MPPSFFFVSQFDARRSRRRPPENPDSDAIAAPEEMLKEKEGDCPPSLAFAATLFQAPPGSARWSEWKEGGKAISSLLASYLRRGEEGEERGAFLEKEVEGREKEEVWDKIRKEGSGIE